VSQRPRFHLAFPVHSLSDARRFYGDVIGCAEGRSADHWVDFDLYGHQIVAHLVADTAAHIAGTNPVDGDDVPVPHFGVLLERDEWHVLAGRFRSVNVKFVIEPHTRFVGEPGEQSTMFVLDPSGNALEFKSFADDAQVFAT
jgi:extradiol dioxygenase family protein